MMIIDNAKDYCAIKNNLTPFHLAQNILMVEPTYFNIEYAINPHMKSSNGCLNTINKHLAIKQWHQLKKVYIDLDYNVFCLPAISDLPDMVFCANQSFPYIDSKNTKKIALSHMYSEKRQKEVLYIRDFFKEQGYEVTALSSHKAPVLFESMGDALWVPNNHLIIGGYGFRTLREAYDRLSHATNCPIAVLELKNPKFYHLDTCLSILTGNVALYYPRAFTRDGIELLKSIFSHLIEVEQDEADSPYFACNAHCPDQKHVILQEGSVNTHETLVQNGFIPVEVDTSEFIKAGGSVFCMKLMFF